MINPNTDETEDLDCTVADMEVLKLEGWTMVFTPNKNSIISGRSWSGNSGSNQTSGVFKDRMREIAKNHPKGNIDV
jgi:hypothetical protein